MRAHLFGTSELLRGRTEFAAKDYRDVLEGATSVDAVYMDPPYQGVCLNRDQRYLKGVQFDEFVAALDSLNRRGVPFVVSYDGRTGDKEHGRRLPESLELLRLEVDAGRSTQATLLGRTHKTYESLYLSPVLMARIGVVPSSLRDDHCEPVSLFDGMP
jgi:DNA adenine methylase